jgi:hypothetical protein
MMLKPSESSPPFGEVHGAKEIPLSGSRLKHA